MTLRFVDANGVRLAVRTSGPAHGTPVLLVHGWAQSGRVWRRLAARPELAAHRLIAVDLRGHGESDVPDDGYQDPAAWAGDLAAVLADAGAPAVLLGWSYGGLVVTDYLRERGGAGVAGVCLAGALTEIGRDRPGGRIGPAMRAALPDALATDPAVAVPAVTRLVEGMGAAEDDRQRLIGETLRVPPAVRRALFRRDVGSADVLAAVRVPVLVAHGDADRVVDPTCADYAAGKIPGARLRWFSGVGHLPFDQRAAEFAAVLHEFVLECAAAPG